MTKHEKGFAICRFRYETGCNRIGSKEYHAWLKNFDAGINVPELWEHYMTDHLVQPTKLEREVIMKTNPDDVTDRIPPGRSYKKFMIMYVERTKKGYSHKAGTEPDTEFIDKLKLILKNAKLLQTK
ncbi:MAG: hypothetical protein V1802_03535 [Candidatus Aenigmatarchaeota archaeon]